jgi:hypothetical protein
LLEVASLPKKYVDTQGSVGRARILFQDYALTILYTTKLEEGSLDVDGYVKSMEAICRRLNDVNLKLPQELVVFMTLMSLPSFGTQRRILESRKDLSIKIIKKDLRQEALRFKTVQAQQPQAHLVVNLTREDSRRRKREKVWFEHWLRFVT